MSDPPHDPAYQRGYVEPETAVFAAALGYRWSSPSLASTAGSNADAHTR